jgi:hypothetical protein
VSNLETNTIVEPCDVTFDETAPCPRDVFECAGHKEMEDSIFVDEGLQGVDGAEDEPLFPSTSSPEPVPASTLEAEAPQVTTSSTATVVIPRSENVEPKLLYMCPGCSNHMYSNNLINRCNVQ